MLLSLSFAYTKISFLRNLGGSIGLALGGTIVLNTVRARLSGQIDETLVRQLIRDPVQTTKSADLTSEQRLQFQHAYRDGFRLVFITMAALAAFAFFIALAFMPQTSVDRQDDEQQKQDALKRIEGKKAARQQT